MIASLPRSPTSLEVVFKLLWHPARFDCGVTATPAMAADGDAKVAGRIPSIKKLKILLQQP